MARSRTPKDKAEVSGAAAKNPQRFRDRAAPKRTRPVGEPYKNMTESQCEAWAEFSYECPWLTSSDRQLLRLACVYSARMNDEGEIGVSAVNTFSALLSKLGATPADKTKVSHDDSDSDEDDEFFRSH
jgi:hypothetical protein